MCRTARPLDLSDRMLPQAVFGELLVKTFAAEVEEVVRELAVDTPEESRQTMMWWRRLQREWASCEPG